MAPKDPPSWGSLPLEQYILLHWNARNGADPDMWRSQLAREFYRLGDPGRRANLSLWTEEETPAIPPRSEWPSILSPVRTEYQRLYALPKSLTNFGHAWGVIWLRTCYESGSDEAHADLVRGLNIDVGLDVMENLLDDAQLYAFGADWKSIFEVMPERLLPIGDMDEPGHDFESANEEAKIRQAKTLEFWNEHSECDMDSSDVTLFHADFTENYLFIADSEAMKSGLVLVVFFDDRGRVVRQQRIKPDWAEDLAGAWFQGTFDETEEFETAELGPEYQRGGPTWPPACDESFIARFRKGQSSE